MKNKHELREAAIERLRDVMKHQPRGPLCADDVTEALVGDGWVESTVDEDAETIIGLLSDDDEPSYECDAFAKGPRDADGILWIRGDMSDSEWGVIEHTYFNGEQWLVCGHDISAPWIPADSICHAPMRTATQRENDLIRLIKDAAKDYQHERSEVEWQKELYRSMSDHVISDTMLLPRDADDEVVHVGDEMVVGDYRYIVAGVGLIDNTEVFFTTDGDESECFPAKACHHYHKPTVEDVLREFAHVGIRIGAENGIQLGKVNLYADEEMVEKFAKKLQLKEEGCE